MTPEVKIELIKKIVSEMYEQELDDKEGILLAIETIMRYGDDK